MSWPLFKYFLKKNWMIWVGVTAFCLFELVACVFLMDIVSDLPEEFLGGFGGESILEIMSILLPMLMFMFPMIFIIFTIYRLVYRPIDSTLSPTLAAGVKRTTYLTTAAVFLVVSLFLMFSVVFTVIGASMLYYGSFNWTVWLKVNFVAFVVLLSVALTGFLFAAAFAPGNIGKLGMFGFPVFCLAVLILAGYIDFFKWLTPFGWIDFTKVYDGSMTLWWLWALLYLLGAGVIYVGSLFLFKRRQLSI